MQKTTLWIGMVIAALLLLAVIFQYEQLSKKQEVEEATAGNALRNDWPDAYQLKLTGAPESCPDPVTQDEPSCEMRERQILASVVRYEMYGPSKDGSGRQAEGLGHGTVVGGRYLLVHNHFGVDLTQFQSPSTDAVITMYNGIGDLFMWKSSPQFTILVEESEAMVLDFGEDEDGEGFFDELRIQSANYGSWSQAAPSPGRLVAQVTWDGHHSDVAWTTIDEVVITRGTPHLVLANSLLPGASGGGVFLDGVHIAVNWERGKHLDETGEIIAIFSTAALNSSSMFEVIQN